MLDYNELAADYSRHRRVHPGVMGALLTRAGLSTVPRVLEVGCGTGNYLSQIRRAVGCDCKGIDPSAEMLTHARQQDGSIDWQIGRAERLPCDDASIDLVFSVDVIHHVSDRHAHFKEAFRVLKPGGSLCTATDSEWIIRNRPLSKYFPETVPIELSRYPTTSCLRQEMLHAGFAEIGEVQVEHASLLSDIQAYRDKAFSALRFIVDEAFERGIRRMEGDLRAGLIPVVVRYVLLWGIKP